MKSKNFKKLSLSKKTISQLNGKGIDDGGNDSFGECKTVGSRFRQCGDDFVINKGNFLIGKIKLYYFYNTNK